MRVAMMVLGGWIGSSIVLSLLVGRVLAHRGSGPGDVPTHDLPANVIPISAARHAVPRAAASAR